MARGVETHWLVGRVLDRSYPSRGRALTGSRNVLVSNRPILRQWDVGEGGWQAIEGAPCVLVNNRRVHRIHDAHSSSELGTGCNCVACGDLKCDAESRPSHFGIEFHVLRRIKKLEGHGSVELPINDEAARLANWPYKVTTESWPKGSKKQKGKPDESTIEQARTNAEGKTRLIKAKEPTRVHLYLQPEGSTQWLLMDTADLLPFTDSGDGVSPASVMRTVHVNDFKLDIYIVHVRFPTRHPHVGVLRVLKGEALASRLWGEKYIAKFNKKNTDHQNLQRCHQAFKPPAHVVSETLQDIVEHPARTLLDNVPCLNYDINKSYEVKDGVIFRITTTDGATPYTFRSDGDKNTFGRVPRLSLGTEAKLAQVHSGREYKRGQLNTLTSSHLIRDKDGTWTNLHITRGCVRVSELWMRSIIDSMDPISNFKAVGDGYELRDTVPEPGAVGFFMANEDPDPNWCAVATDAVKYTTNDKKGVATDHDVPLCASADDMDAQMKKDNAWSLDVFKQVLSSSGDK